MILKENQRVNIVVRGLAFKEGHLLATQWQQDGTAFGIGGRVDFGEPLLAAVAREFLEETGVGITVRKLLYFGENIFAAANGRQYHEYGWYFLVEPDGDICALDEVVPNPDDPGLIIRYLPVDETGLQNFWPRFLAHYLPGDLARSFADNPRHIYNRDGGGTADLFIAPSLVEQANLLFGSE